MKKLTTYVTAVSLSLLPFVALAEGEFDDGFGGIGDFFTAVLSFINNILIPVVIGLALLMFIWGMFKYFILGGGDEGNRQEGRQLMLYSILAFFMMVAIFGVVNLLTTGFGFDDDESIQGVPQVDIRNES